MLKMLADNIHRDGIRYGNQFYRDVEVCVSDEAIEDEHINIRMLSPLSVHSTDPSSGKTVFYGPDDDEFAERVSYNFMRKYFSCYGIMPDSGISIEPLKVSDRDKYVTKYKNFYISGWLGEYSLWGKRKYLDFLYHTGLGSKNSQGFGMFELKQPQTW